MRTPLAKCTLTKVSHELPGGKAATSTLGSARFDHKLTSSLTMCNVAHATRVIFTVWTGTKALAWAGCKLVEVNGVRSGVLLLVFAVVHVGYVCCVLAALDVRHVGAEDVAGAVPLSHECVGSSCVVLGCMPSNHSPASRCVAAKQLQHHHSYSGCEVRRNGHAHRVLVAG